MKKEIKQSIKWFTKQHLFTQFLIGCFMYFCVSLIIDGLIALSSTPPLLYGTIGIVIGATAGGLAIFFLFRQRRSQQIKDSLESMKELSDDLLSQINSTEPPKEQKSFDELTIVLESDSSTSYVLLDHQMDPHQDPNLMKASFMFKEKGYNMRVLKPFNSAIPKQSSKSFESFMGGRFVFPTHLFNSN